MRSALKPAIALLGLGLVLAAVLWVKGARISTVPSPSPTQVVSIETPAASTETPVPNTENLYDWLQFNFDPAHSGYNTLEIEISPANVSNLTRLFQISLSSVVDGSPVYLAGASTISGTRDLLFVTTQAGDIVALDASVGTQIWVKHNPAGSCSVNNLGGVPCFTTSSPAIDPNRQYVYSYGLEGQVHKYQVADGVEVTEGGWPQLVTLKPFDEKGSSALSIATAKNGVSYLYVTSAGYLGDEGEYQGHLTTINLSNGSQNVFNALCSNQAVHFASALSSPSCEQLQAGVWARPGVVYDPELDRIYMATGNGLFDPLHHHWGDSVLALNPDGTGLNGDPLDSYTPKEHEQMSAGDLDLGSSAPALLPVPANSKVSHLALEVGKDTMLRLINLDDLSGQGAPGHIGGEVATPIALPSDGVVRTQPAVWVNPSDGRTWVFIADDNTISAFRLEVDDEGNPSLQFVWQNLFPGTSPIIANGILFYASNPGITALDPTSGRLLWWDPPVAAFHWQSPMVAKGVLYITDDDGRLTAYGLPPMP